MTALPISAAIKFGRTYQMSVLGRNNQRQIIRFPTTLVFDITHNIFASANVGNFSLYNLSQTKRSEIAFSTYTKAQQYDIQLRAGYISQQPLGVASALSSLPVIFDGYVNVAYTERQGPNLITQINAFDNGDITSNAEPSATFGLTANSYTAKVGTSFTDMVRAVMNCFPKSSGITAGQIVLKTAFVNKTPATQWQVTGADRPFIGRVWEALEELASDAGAYVYIENGTCNMLGPLDVISPANNLGILQPSTGLLGIPKYTDATVICSMVFEPSLTIGAQIELKSKYNSEANGPCRIVAYSHRGTISGVESGTLSTDVTLMKLTTPLGAGVGP